MRVLLIFLIVVLSSTYLGQYSLDNSLIDEGFTINDVVEFDMYETRYNKHYSNPYQRRLRMSTYRQKKLQIIQHNTEARQDKWGINHFTDIDDLELTWKTFMHIPEPIEDRFIQSKKVLVQSSFPPVDWRLKNGVTPVQDQGNCGSCWAFATTDTLIGRLSAAGKASLQQLWQSLMKYLTQNLAKYNCYGCNGGYPQYALQHIAANGIQPELKYKSYMEMRDYCDFNQGEIGKNAFIIENILKPTVQIIEQHLQKGPVIILAKTTVDWFKYSSGVINTCYSSTIKTYLHAMSIVGFDDNNWIVKNSWSTDWGEKGFLRMSKLNCNSIVQMIVPVVK